MQELLQHYQALYEQSPAGSACEIAALYILWTLNHAGGLSPCEALLKRVSECQELVRSVGATDQLAEGVRVSGSCQALTLADYYREQLSLYEQCLTALAAVS